MGVLRGSFTVEVFISGLTGGNHSLTHDVNHCEAVCQFMLRCAWIHSASYYDVAAVALNQNVILQLLCGHETKFGF